MALSRRTFIQGTGAILGLSLMPMSMAGTVRAIGSDSIVTFSDVAFDARVPESEDFASALSRGARLHPLSGDPASCWWRIRSEASSIPPGITGLTTWQDTFVLSQMAREKGLTFIHVGEHRFSEAAIRHRLLLPASIGHGNLFVEDKGAWAGQLAGAMPIVVAAGAGEEWRVLEAESRPAGRFLGQLHSWAMVRVG